MADVTQLGKGKAGYMVPLESARVSLYHSALIHVCIVPCTPLHLIGIYNYILPRALHTVPLECRDPRVTVASIHVSYLK